MIATANALNGHNGAKGEDLDNVIAMDHMKFEGW